MSTLVGPKSRIACISQAILDFGRWNFSLGKLKGLKRLELASCALGSHSSDHWPKAAGLRTLKLEGCATGQSPPDGLGRFKQLQHFALSDRNPGKALSQLFSVRAPLRELHLDSTKLSLKDIQRTFAFKQLRRLSLPLDQMNLGDTAGLYSLKHLKSLEIRGKPAPPKMAKWLGQLTLLEELILDQGGFGDKQLPDLFPLTRLRALRTSGQGFSKKAWLELAEQTSLPPVAVE